MTAVTISLGADGGFDLQVPSTLEHRTHVIHIPASTSGLSILRKVLSERNKEIAKLGNPSSPTQFMVEEWLRQDRINRATEKAAEAEKKETERTLAAAKAVEGLDLGSLDL